MACERGHRRGSAVCALLFNCGVVYRGGQNAVGFLFILCILISRKDAPNGENGDFGCISGCMGLGGDLAAFQAPRRASGGGGWPAKRLKPPYIWRLAVSGVVLNLTYGPVMVLQKRCI